MTMMMCLWSTHNQTIGCSISALSTKSPGIENKYERITRAGILSCGIFIQRGSISMIAHLHRRKVVACKCECDTSDATISHAALTNRLVILQRHFRFTTTSYLHSKVSQNLDSHPKSTQPQVSRFSASKFAPIFLQNPQSLPEEH